MSSMNAGAALGASSSAGASATSQALMGQLATQSKQAMANNLAMGRMSQEAALSEALGKKFKAAGDSVKGLV
ncbi:hypothetical protein [Roseateles depolymerans]|uniref:Uncharacterized protein n=1 Tax=Roseateles depolymerans TaxID=76731 RepID=A0A0U3N078_9BURK|nr:hypothetical protein [Roseateles depolymerans]ALV07572.1 hypothetical protein RD2015_3111 [Roseateles depolymerans]REG22212.1 hypothetical protein DES44_1356 [Roseateles depolymerans]